MDITQFPLPMAGWFGENGSYIIYLLIGFAFGYVLEISGFGWSPKLAAQFYFKDLTVLKVMFTGIIVAMTLIFAASAVGLLDYSKVWVNPTYIWPGIVGGLIMGVGFIVGGFCPGTSLVSAVTLKIDGILFVLGTLTGIFLFGETVESFDTFWHSSYLGRFTIMDWLNVDAGVAVLGVILMALFMFWGGEQLERVFGGLDLKKEPRLRIAGAGALVLVGAAVLLIGQPTNADRWDKISFESEAKLAAREVQIHPGELLATMHNHKLKLVMVDVRSEAEYNMFHIEDAQNITLDDLSKSMDEFHLEQPDKTVIVVMSNDEEAATEAWRLLVSDSVLNVYILEGGINNWISIFGSHDTAIQAQPTPTPDSLDYAFTAALGSNYHAARPQPGEITLEYTPKIKLDTQTGPKGGGCG